MGEGDSTQQTKAQRPQTAEWILGAMSIQDAYLGVCERETLGKNIGKLVGSR